MPPPPPPIRPQFSNSSTAYDSSSTPCTNSILKPEKASMLHSSPYDADTLLPPPAVHFTGSHASSSRGGHRTFAASTKRGLRMAYDRVMRKFGSGTAPETSTTDLESESGAETSEGYTCQTRSGPGGPGTCYKREQQVDEVDEVVVDREWGEDVRASSATHSEHGEKSASHQMMAHEGAMDAAVAEDLAQQGGGFWGSHPVLVYLRWRMWPPLRGFFVMQFLDEKSEEQYKKENWFMRKHLALWSAAYYILNWVLSVIFVPKPIQFTDKIFHYAFAPLFAFPIFFMVLWDFPRDRPVLYQIVLTISTWQYAIYQVLFIFLCGYYGPSQAIPKPVIWCGTKDFLPTFYYANGPQTIALFGLGLNRFPALLGALTFMSACFGWIVPVRTTWVRNVINFMCFQAFLLYTHYMRENAERRLYTLRDQLKVQFRATQKAQVNERKAADSKRRLTSYVFHEVRVPLNTALLAVQNMAASGSGVVSRGEQAIEFKALEGSLGMMSKVLNDVLDFNRMDSGRFESVARPYPFHQVMRSMFVPLKLATDARGLEFEWDLDRRIDEVARCALFEAIGMVEVDIGRKLRECPDEDGIVVGDETRLRQIVTNLASNACKFTPAGGKLKIRTTLVLPQPSQVAPPVRGDSDTTVFADSNGGKDTRSKSGTSTTLSPESSRQELGDYDPAGTKGQVQLSRTHLARHDSLHGTVTPSTTECIVVRIEITDTGKGIRSKDMVQCKLFSAFNQTELGRQQGGKGTGLGLALVRQIVKLSGGRLGVKSKANEGSTFWVELPLGVGAKAAPWSAETPQFMPQTDPLRPGLGSPLLVHHDHGLHSMTAMYTPTPRSALPRTTSSAMHSIMDQGGMVEISPDGVDDGKILTRSIGDPSTGTDPTPSAPLTMPDSPIPPSLRPPEAITHRAPPEIPPRPQYVELPDRPEFHEDMFASVLPHTPHSTHTTPAHTPSDSVHSTSPRWENGMRVLVVDDDPLTRKLMARMLTRFGCRVSTAENGDIALELILGNAHSRMTPSSEDTECGGLSMEMASTSGAEEYKYAIVFLDNQMPVMSGLDVVRRLREMGRRDFVVGVTGNALLSDQQEYLHAGADHVLTKPVYEKSLKGMLTLADQRRQRATPSAEVSDPTSLHPHSQ